VEKTIPFLWYGARKNLRSLLRFLKDRTMSPAETANHSRRWLILAVIGIAQLMVVLDATIVNIALPSAQADLGFTDDSRQWVITAYALAFGSLLLLGGRIGDLYGRKRVFIVGLLGFAAASAIGGAAQSFGVLVGARALQGVFGALLAPAALGLLTTIFTDPAERAKAFGIFGAIAGAGAAIGLLLGGILTEYLNWRWSLYVNLLFALPTAAAALTLLQDARLNSHTKLDIPGTLTASSGLFALVFGFSSAETRAWDDPVTIVALALAAILIAAFVAVERRVAHPLLPLRVVLDRNRGAAYLAVGISGVAMFGVFLFLTYFLQTSLGFSPLETGLAFLAMTFSIVVTATSATTKLLPRFGARPLVTSGLALASLAMLFFTGISVESTYAADVLPGLIMMGIGFGLVMAPSMAAATFGVAPADAGVASAMVNTGQQIGGSIGTALLSTLAASATSGQLAGVRPTPDLVAAAAVHGYTTAFWWAAGILFVGAFAIAFLLRDVRPQTAASAAAEPAFAH
jgi:EmrB/QacA subfamily drug resistance transporter